MTRQIQAPNGDVIEFPDNMSDSQIEAVMRREYPAPAPARPPTPRTPVQTAANAINTLNQGLSFGLDDEFQGAVAGVGAMLQGRPFGPAYDQARQRVLGGNAQLRQDAPFVSGALEGAGATVPILATMGGSIAPQMAAQAPRGLGGLAGTMAHGAAAGAGMGYAYGVGTGEGDLIQRSAQATPSALIGAGVGAATPLAVNAGGAALRAVLPRAVAAAERIPVPEANTLGSNMGQPMRRTPPRRPAGPTIPGDVVTAVDRWAGRSGQTPEQVAQRVAEVQRRPQGQVLADVFGQPAVQTLRANSHFPGQSSELLTNAARRRAADSPDYIARAITGPEGFNVGSESRASAAANLDAAEEALHPQFEALFGPTTPRQEQLVAERVAPIIQRSQGLSGFRRAAQDARGIFQAQTGSEDINTNVGLYLHILKNQVGLAADFDAASQGGMQQGALRRIYGQLNRAIDPGGDGEAIVAGYRAPVAAQQRIIQARQALTTGYNWYSQDHNFIRRQIGQMSPDELYHARVGLAERIMRTTAGSDGRMINVANAISNNNVRRSIAAAFDNPTQAADFLDEVVRTQQQLMGNASGWVGGPTTSQDLAHQAEALNTALEAGGELVNGRPVAAAGRIAQRVWNVGRMSATEAHNDRVTRAALTPINRDTHAFTEELLRQLRQREIARRTNATASAAAARAAGSQVGRQNGQ